MNAAIAIDRWKLSIFTIHLSNSGYTYKVGPGLTKDMLIITVKTDDKDALQTVVLAANTEAAASKTAQETKTWH